MKIGFIVANCKADYVTITRPGRNPVRYHRPTESSWRRLAAAMMAAAGQFEILPVGSTGWVAQRPIKGWDDDSE